MSDFISTDHLPDLWEEILKKHWTFLDTEESLEKIEERKKLEGCLKEFLSVVPHDRKFFLPETEYVLKESIREIEDFTAHNGIIGFETISHYANNLFMRPWRKEYRVLRMYSGTYTHDVRSNLVHAIKLFEAMGYKRMPNETLILDGPICPDQVTNVSRDALTAHVECKIMSEIASGLAAMGIKCSIRDIYNYRENHIGGVPQTIQGLVNEIEDAPPPHRKEKLLCDNSYSTIQNPAGNTRLPATLPLPPPPPQPQQMVSQCLNCPSSCCYHNIMHSKQQCTLNGNQMQSVPSVCPLHPSKPTKLNALCNCNKLYTQYNAPNMLHSHSLEHYNEPPAPILPYRHSYDYQGCSAHQGHYQVPRSHAQYAHLYESPYDCTDGAADDSLEESSASYAAVGGLPNNSFQASAYSHPYNVSGNRYPLPYNISNQLNAVNHCNDVKAAIVTYGTSSLENVYATISKSAHNRSQLNPQSTYKKQPTRMFSVQNAAKDCYSCRQQIISPEHLIDFDDRAPLTSHDYHAQLSDYHDGDRACKHQQSQRFANSSASGLIPTYSDPKDNLDYHHASTTGGNATSSDDVYVSSLYAKPMPRNNSRSKAIDGGSKLDPQTKHMTDKYIRKTDSLQGYDDNNRKTQMELINRNVEKLNIESRKKLSNHKKDCDTSDLSYESAAFDDFVTIGHSEHPQRSPTQASKNEDGVGSFETWDYVFQNLERSGYSKDLGERGDLLVQSLDLDALNLSSGVGGGANLNTLSGGGNGGGGGGGGGGGVGQTSNVEKRRSNNQIRKENQQFGGEKSRTLEKLTSAAGKCETKTTKPEAKPSILKQTASVKGAAKKSNKTATLKPILTNSSKIDYTKSNGSINANGGGGGGGGAAFNITENNKSKTIAAARSKQQQTPLPTQVIEINPNEWSCHFCTFLNPDTKRICEMCCRSKDFNVGANVSNRPTCV